uniref:Uncharacterized protein n=1 Tax=Megaselia scalaris TaxID=36166 RepID=T1GPL1_MEGSC
MSYACRKSVKRKNVPRYIRNEEGIYAESSSDVLNFLLETHSPGCTEVENVDASFVQRNFQNIEQSIITEGLIKWALESFSPFKSQVHTEITKSLMQIYKGCLNLGYIPKNWRELKR